MGGEHGTWSEFHRAQPPSSQPETALEWEITQEDWDCYIEEGIEEDVEENIEEDNSKLLLLISCLQHPMAGVTKVLYHLRDTM